MAMADTPKDRCRFVPSTARLCPVTCKREVAFASLLRMDTKHPWAPPLRIASLALQSKHDELM